MTLSCHWQLMLPPGGHTNVPPHDTLLGKRTPLLRREVHCLGVAATILKSYTFHSFNCIDLRSRRTLTIDVCSSWSYCLVLFSCDAVCTQRRQQKGPFTHQVLALFWCVRRARHYLSMLQPPQPYLTLFFLAEMGRDPGNISLSFSSSIHYC